MSELPVHDRARAVHTLDTLKRSRIIMEQKRSFALVTTADLIARSAYQMGKTPLLPIFAASLGAGDVFLGLIVSVSTLTGMILKPLVGVFSDRWGRRMWLIVGTALCTHQNSSLLSGSFTAWPRRSMVL
jgi:MFS family permease